MRKILLFVRAHRDTWQNDRDAFSITRRRISFREQWKLGFVATRENFTMTWSFKKSFNSQNWFIWLQNFVAVKSILNALFSTAHFPNSVAELKFLEEKDHTATDYIVSVWSLPCTAAKQLDLFTAVPIVKGGWQKKITALLLQIIVAFPQYLVVSTRVDGSVSQNEQIKKVRCQH